MLEQLSQKILRTFSPDDERLLVTFTNFCEIRKYNLDIDFCTQCVCARCCDIFADSFLYRSLLNACSNEHFKCLHVHDFTCINLTSKDISLFDYICLKIHSERHNNTNVCCCNVILQESCCNSDSEPVLLTDHEFAEIHCTCCYKDYHTDVGFHRFCFCHKCVRLTPRDDLYKINNEWLKRTLVFLFIISGLLPMNTV